MKTLKQQLKEHRTLINMPITQKEILTIIKEWLTQKLIQTDNDEYHVWEEYYNEIINNLIKELTSQ